VSKDVELTDQEKQVLAEIERHEDELRTEVPWTRLQRRDGARRDLWAWAAVVIGTAVLATGLAANVALVPFVGFVILLAGATPLSARFSPAGWRIRLHTIRRNLSAPRSGQDGT